MPRAIKQTGKGGQRLAGKGKGKGAGRVGTAKAVQRGQGAIKKPLSSGYLARRNRAPGDGAAERVGKDLASGS